MTLPFFFKIGTKIMKNDLLFAHDLFIFRAERLEHRVKRIAQLNSKKKLNTKILC
jgi:hypothetical protein